MPFYTNPIYPPFMNQNYPNVDSMQNKDITNLEEKINILNTEINNLKSRISKLESNNNYTSSYKANSYNMM